MLTQVDILDGTNPVDRTVVTFDVVPRELRSSYFVKDIEGLEPLETELFTTPMTSSFGEKYDGGRFKSRDLTFRVKYEPKYEYGETIESLRRTLYSNITPMRKVRLKFYDFKTLYLDGYIENLTPVLFSKDPEIIVTVRCPETPFFYEKGVVTITKTSGTAFYMEPDLGSAPTPYSIELINPTETYSLVRLLLGLEEVFMWNNSDLISAGTNFKLSTFPGDRAVRVGGQFAYSKIQKGSLSHTLPPYSAREVKVEVRSSSTSRFLPVTIKFNRNYIGL